MSLALILLFTVIAYFAVLIGISFLTSKDSSNESFFVGNRKSPWFVVAFGMIGASLSGVTFISIPGQVQASSFSYLAMVLGYIPGYLIIAFVLLPLYYKLNLVTIYTYLKDRFGIVSYRSGAIFFLISRLIGSSLRLYLVALVLQTTIFDAFNIPFWLTVAITILLIWAYTFRSGIKTIIYTDTLQTVFMIAATVMMIYGFAKGMSWTSTDIFNEVGSRLSNGVYISDGNSPKYFWKQFFAGMLIAIAMTGLDQDMMQKNLSCKNLKDAQKNMLTFIPMLILTNIVFLGMGAMMYKFVAFKSISLPELSDKVLPFLAVNELSQITAIIFIVGIIAAAYSSADSALTALTTSFCIDILDIEKKPIENQKGIRVRSHIMFSFLSFLVVLAAHQINRSDVIDLVFRLAGYTYGPLLGLFVFGMYTKFQIRDKYVFIVVILAPILSYILDDNSADWFNGFKIGYMILLVNGLITFLGLLALTKKSEHVNRI